MPRRVRLTLLAGAVVLLALSAAAPAAQAPSPVVVKDPRDATTGAPDLTRVQLGLTSDRRLRAALTLGVGWQARDLIAREGPPGSLCLRLWTVTKPGAQPPDFLVCITARQDGETTRGSILRAGEHGGLVRVGSAVVGRTSDRTATLRFSQSAIGRPARIRFAAEATKPGCARVSCVDTAPNAPQTAIFRPRGSS